MEPAFAYGILASFVVSLVSLAGIATLSLNEQWLRRGMNALIGLAAGALLGDAFIHLIPETFEAGVEGPVFALSVLGGILVFLIIERYLHWYNRNNAHRTCPPGEVCVVDTTKPLGALVIFGDGVHNFVDGAVIAASFMVSVPLGITTTIAVFLHEIPQEISDFALLLHAGFTRARALLWNFMSGILSVLGAFTFFFVGDLIENIEPIAAAFTAGGFIYIAAANLVPELQKTEHPGRAAVEFIAVLVGIGLMFALLTLK